jgi:CSLREA domain-containing protein
VHQLRFKWPLVFVLLSLAFLLFASPSVAAGGSTFTVNDTTDAVDANPGDGVCATAQGKCTLRAAVQEANATPGADTIILPEGTYKLTIPGTNDAAAAGDLDILDDVHIQGAGSAATVIDANQLDSAFDIYHGQYVGQHIEISGVTIRNGLADYGAGIMINPQAVPGTVTLTDVVVRDSHARIAGGGIDNHEHLVISDSVITGNRAASGDIGGGIFNAGDLTISDSTISNNSADAIGGGLYNVAGPAAITGSTFSGNSAGSEGGGVANLGGVVTMTNVTFSGNTAGSAGGGIYNGVSGSQMTLLNATLAGDSAPAAQEISHDSIGPFHLKNTIIAGATPGKNCAGTLSSDGHNLASDATCGLTQGEKKNTDPMLGPLADNGGPTQTRALLVGSPAIDAGSSDCPPPATDQRGTARPQGGCDIGAFELAITARIWGDLRCDGAVDGTDALADLLNVAGTPPITQTQPCPHIGVTVEVQGFSPHIWGDVDCSGAIDAQDALRIERYLAGLAIPPINSCPSIGSSVQLIGG